MAKHNGIIPIKGTVGNMTFLDTKDGLIVRKKSNFDGSRIATEANFIRTRENMAEFSRAGNAGRVLRQALAAIMDKASDKRVTSRLTGQLVRVVKADTVNDRGKRNVLDGELELLQGFEFNKNSSLHTSFKQQFFPSIDRVTGTLKVDIAAFAAAELVAAPTGSTHYRLFIAGSSVDFELEHFETSIKSTDPLPAGDAASPAISLVSNVTANSTHPLFLVLGIEFMQIVNGKNYPMKDNSFNSMAIVQVSGV